jgi:hypothetical protein
MPIESQSSAKTAIAEPSGLPRPNGLSQPVGKPHDSRDDSGKPHSHSAIATIRSIVASGENDSQIWSSILGLIAGHWDSPYATVRIVTQRGMVQEEFHQFSMTPESWRLCVVPELTHAVTSGEDRSQSFSDQKSGIQISVHTIPVIDRDGSPCGALAIATDGVSPAIADATREQLSLLLGFALQAGWDPDAPLPAHRGADEDASFPSDQSPDGERHETPKMDASPTSGSAVASPAEMDQTCRRASLAARYQSVEELAFHVTNSIKTRLGCIEVAIGLVRGKKVRLLAISGQDTVYRGTPGAQRLSQAMEECLDHGGLVYAQQEPLEGSDIQGLEMPIHQRISSLTKGSNCVSITLGETESPTAVLTLRRGASNPFSGPELDDLRNQFNAVAEAIQMLQVARQGVLSHASESILATVRKIFSRRGRREMLMVAAGVIAIGLLVCQWPHSMYLEARFSSPNGRIYAAPIDGRVAAVHVVPGQHIAAGQLLFEIDTDQQRRELERLRNQIRQHRVRMVQSLGQHDPSGAAAAKCLLDADTMTAQQLVGRIETAKVYAEEAGVLIRGEGHLRVGERVPYGDAILHVAADRSREVQIRLDDSIAGDVEVGMSGWFAAKGQPDRKLRIEIVRIECQTAVEDGRNLIAAWAELPADVGTLPLGAEGYARIEVGGKPGWWILFNQPWRKLRWYLWPV